MNHQELLDLGWTYAGNIGVDSGQAMICDPCYVLRDEDDDRPPETTYRKVCAVNVNPEKYPTYGPVPYRKGHEGCAVKASSGYGDGLYPVYVMIQDCDEWGKRIVAMMADFGDESDSKELRYPPTEPWLNDRIQFPRLLAEIAMTDLPYDVWNDLCRSMDLTEERIRELFDRAEKAWTKIKEQTNG